MNDNIVLCLESAEDLGLVRDVYRMPRCDVFRESSVRARVNRKGQEAIEALKNTPNCVGKDLLLFEFQREVVEKAIRKQIDG